MRNRCEIVSQLLRNIDCAKIRKLRDNAQRCATIAQDCEITQHYDEKGAKSLVDPNACLLLMAH